MWCAVRPSRTLRRAFSLAELLVVIGVIALLMALLFPPLRSARHQAIATQCGANIQQIGHGLSQAHFEFSFYPLWDDNGDTTRYTWIDLLAQRRYTNERSGYCGGDDRPDFLNEARGQAFGLLYPPNRTRFGINYSYAISVPLSAGAWAWSGGDGDGRPRQLFNADRDPARRVLAADGYWSGLYNLGNEALQHRIWNSPTQYDNVVAYRHAKFSGNLLHQDGHVARARYDFGSEERVNTMAQYVWYPGEPLAVGPEDQYEGQYYPAFPSNKAPNELRPEYYTLNDLWTTVRHDGD